MDLEYHYNESVTITPRNYTFHFCNNEAIQQHYAMIGIAMVADGYPLYYDATNEQGLSVAGLNFPGNAVYRPCKDDAVNIGSFEFIPWILGRCASVREARDLLARMRAADVPFVGKREKDEEHA